MHFPRWILCGNPQYVLREANSRNRSPALPCLVTAVVLRFGTIQSHVRRHMVAVSTNQGLSCPRLCLISLPIGFGIFVLHSYVGNPAAIHRHRRGYRLG